MSRREIPEKEYNKLSRNLFSLDGIEEKRDYWDHYEYMGNGVPRVTHILSQCKNTDGLIRWAANVGRRKYDYYRELALESGTLAHEMVEQYLISKYKKPSITNFVPDFDSIPSAYRNNVYNSFKNFELWEQRLNTYNSKIEKVIGLEVPITCPWFGGTIDGIITINRATYIVDFKTSKKISSEYLLQVCAYMWVVNNYYRNEFPHIDGVGIIRLDKSKCGVVDDYFLNDFNRYQHNMIVDYTNCFFSYVDAYYRTINTDYNFETYKEYYNPERIYGG